MQTFSPIQNHILSKLKNAKSLRYAEMQLKGTPNDLYNYHLQFLVKKGFVEKVGDEGYSLSSTGVKHVADPVPPADGKPQITSLFKVNVITIASRVRDGKIQVLNQVRNSNPSFGKIGVMGGVVLKGETTLDAARRKLQVETGLTGTFRLVGMERRIMYTEEGLFSDVLFPIAHCAEPTGELRDTEYGKNMWVDIDEAVKNESAPFDSIQGIKKALEALRDGKLSSLSFFYDETVKTGKLSELIK